MEIFLGMISQPDSSALEKNIDAVQYYIKSSFSETRKDISEGLNSFKEGFTDKLNKTGAYIKNDIVLPVNNFIKDISQIEQEFEAEKTSNTSFCICIEGRMIPVEEVLKMPMEENY